MLLAASVCCAVSIVYWPSLAQPFHFDDRLFLRDDNVRLGRWEAFVLPPVPRCLTWLTFVVQYRVNGASPAAYHAVNLILHGANSVLVFVLLSMVLGGRGLETASVRDRARISLAAAIGAMFFAAHPVQTESVLLVYQRSTLLAAFFGFLSLICWIRCKRPPAGSRVDRRMWLEPMAAGLYLLAVAAKEWAVILPLLFWIHDWVFESRSRPTKRLLPLLALGAVAGAAIGVAALAGGQLAFSHGLGAPLAYAAAQVHVWALYFGLILRIAALSIDHQTPALGGFPNPVWWLCLAALATLVFLFWRVRRRDSRVAFFGLAFFVLLLPSSSVFPSPDLAFEHRLYGPLFGVAGLIAVVALKLIDRSAAGGAAGAAWFRPAPLAVGVGVCLLLSLLAVGAVRRVDVWNDPVSLWRDAAAKSPDKYRPNYNLGVLLVESQPREADQYLSRAIEIDPSQVLAYRSLGEARLRLGLEDQAEQLWKQALLLAPNDFDTLLALGKLERGRRHYFEAKRRLLAAERVQPDAWEVHYQLGALQQDFGFVAESVPFFERALELNPSLPELYYALAAPMTKTGNWDRAIELYRQGLALAPEDAKAHYRLALIYRRAGETEKAQAEVAKGIEVAKDESELAAGRALLDPH